MQRLYLTVSVVSVLFAQALDAQQRPDLSGDWTRAVDSASAGGRTVAVTGDASFRRGDMGSGWGASLVVRQRADSLILEYDFFSAYDLQPRVRLAYAMDGSESRNSVMIGHAASGQRARLTWQGNAVVITTSHPEPRSADGWASETEVRHTLTLESPNTLVVEVARAGVPGGAATTTRTVYIRK
ncbi:MAG: hypothetical protein AABZ80_05870 [Gemmatimonadota bacterium]